MLTLFVPSSLVNELALTARKMFADEAKSSGLVRYPTHTRSRRLAPTSNLYFFLPPPHSRVFADKEAMMAAALEMAAEIAGRSPVAVQGTKVNLIYSRDHGVAQGLDYMVAPTPPHS